MLEWVLFWLICKKHFMSIIILLYSLIINVLIPYEYSKYISVWKTSQKFQYLKLIQKFENRFLMPYLIHSGNLKSTEQLSCSTFFFWYVLSENKNNNNNFSFRFYKSNERWRIQSSHCSICFEKVLGWFTKVGYTSRKLWPIHCSWWL